MQVVAGVAKTPTITGITAGIGGIGFNPNDDFIDVIVHSEGGGYVIWIDKIKTVVTEATLATLLTPIKATNKTIRLLSCSDLESATRLSIALGNYSVIASNSAVILYLDGTVQTSQWYQIIGNNQTLINYPLTPPIATTDRTKFVRLGPACAVCDLPTRQAVCSKMDDVYNRFNTATPAQRTNAFNALNKICGFTIHSDARIDSLATRMLNVADFPTATALSLFLREVEGITGGSFKDNIGKLNIPVLEAWLKLKDTNFSKNYEYLRMLSYNQTLTCGTATSPKNIKIDVTGVTGCTTSNKSANSIRVTSNGYHNDITITNGKHTIVATAGSTNANPLCNDLLNVHPLLQIEDAEYIIDGRYKYITDAQGRVKQISGELLSPNTNNQAPSARKRNADQQTYLCNALKDGTQSADDGGHMIAKDFFGASEQINYFPQPSSVNRSPGDWRTMEIEWDRIRSGAAGVPAQTVKVDIKPQFTGNSKRPDSFKIKQKYGNGQFIDRTDIQN